MRRLFIEADGVLMDRVDLNRPEELLKEGYYAMRVPEWRMIGAVNRVIRVLPQTEIYVVLHVPLALEQAKAELAEWFGRYFPCAKALRFLPVEEYFGSYIALQKGDILLSADIRTIAVFTLWGGTSIGVDIDKDAIPGITSVSSRDSVEPVADKILDTIIGREVRAWRILP